MSSVVARRTPSGYIGRYHHNCGDPCNLGRALYRLRNGYFRGGTGAMLRVLIDEHPAGWSDIIGMDFALPPGFVEPRPGLSPKQFPGLPDYRRPRCYCHGDQNEEPVTFTEASTPMIVTFLSLIGPTSHAMDGHGTKRSTRRRRSGGRSCGSRSKMNRTRVPPWTARRRIPFWAVDLFPSWVIAFEREAR